MDKQSRWRRWLSDTPSAGDWILMAAHVVLGLCGGFAIGYLFFVIDAINRFRT